MKRIFLIVLDSFGIGQAPDAADFGDVGANTLRSIAASPAFSVKNLERLGLFHIDGVAPAAAKPPLAAVARMTELSRGKDTTIGHWEIAGIVSPRPLPTYPQGFPREVIDPFCRATGRGVLCNRPYSGTQVIADFGQEHLKTGSLIVYTSADSVFQIAAHEELISPQQLYDYCRDARQILCGKHAVGRVIARPFAGQPGHFVRTERRRDFSLPPPEKTVLDALSENGREVIAVGKITDIFAGRGITRSVTAHGNKEGMAAAMQLLKEPFEGLCFINLVDFDMLYGHRQDVDGYAAAMTAFDRFLGDFLPQLQPEDAVIITADHGCDPGDRSTDHTREYTPFLMYGAEVCPGNLGTRTTFADIAATVADALGVRFSGAGVSMLPLILKGAKRHE